MSGSEGGLDRVLAQLESEQMPADVAAACLALSIICNQPRGPLPLKGLAAKLIPLLQSKDTAVQANALAALSAAIETSADVANEAIAHDAPATLATLLASDTWPTATLLNSLGALGSLAEFGAQGIDAVLHADAVPAIIKHCSAGGDAAVNEAAVDTICKIASSGIDHAIPGLREAGVVPALATVLSRRGEPGETVVRALMALAMVLRGDDSSHVAFASSPGAVRAILRLTRQDEDADCRIIAAGLFQALGKCEAAKASMAAAIRGDL